MDWMRSKTLATRVTAIAAGAATTAALLVAAAAPASAATQLFAYAAGGASSPTSCPQTSTAASRCSLGQALQLAAPGDTVLLAEAGPYGGHFRVSTPGTSAGAPVTMAPAPGVVQPVLDGNGNGTVLTIDPGVHAAMDAVTVRNGLADPTQLCPEEVTALGGGIYNGGTLTVSGARFTGNSADVDLGRGRLLGYGGAIYNAGTLTVASSTFDGNRSDVNAGAISNGDHAPCGYDGTATATITDSRFTANDAYVGAAISSGANGGDATLTVRRSTFSGNGSTDLTASGGAIANPGGGIASISESTFTRNIADRGGAISSPGPLAVRNSTFAANTGEAGSDAIEHTTGIPSTVTSSTFVNDTIGGGGALTLAATIMAKSPGLAVGNGCQSPVVDGGYNISDEATCGFSAAQHSVSDSPTIDDQLGSLGPHGGPTDTVPLSPSSDNPANDVVPADFAPEGAAVCAGTDQRGLPRGTPCDIGAVESPINGASLFAYPHGGAGDAVADCPRTDVVADQCTLTTALHLAGAGSVVELARSGDPNDPSTWYSGTYDVARLPGSTADRQLTIRAATGVTNPIIDGNLSSASIFALDHSYVTFQGFTVQRGRKPANSIANRVGGGSAIAVNAGHVTATGMRLLDNSGVVIAGAISPDPSGVDGSIALLDSSVAVSAQGSAVRAEVDDVTLTRSTLTGNGSGGGILARQVTMARSTATGLSGSAINAGNVTVTDSTISDNGGVGLITAVATVTGATFARNAGGALRLQSGGTVRMAATLLIRSVGGAPNCIIAGPGSDAYTVADDDSCGLTGTGSVQNSADIAGYLGAIGDHGGPTPTVPLLATSTIPGAGPNPARRVIPADFVAPGAASAHCSTNDQRGVARTPNCDVGAFELGGTAPKITSGASTTFTAGQAGTFTVTASGDPAPALSLTGALPGGVTFTDRNDGTATLAGTTTQTGAFPVTITAHNGSQPDATQAFTLTVQPQDTTPPVSTLTFAPGALPSGQQLVTITGKATFLDQNGEAIGTVPVTCANTTSTKATFTATDSGSGVASLTYSASGAQTIPPTTVTTLPTTVTISAPGATVLTHFGTDRAGNVEPTSRGETALIGSVGKAVYACGFSTPTFAVPVHGSVKINGTATSGGKTKAFAVTIKY